MGSERTGTEWGQMQEQRLLASDTKEYKQVKYSETHLRHHTRDLKLVCDHHVP
jgi:hypothetical protein